MKQAGQYRQGPGRAPASHDFRARPPQPSREAAPAGSTSRPTVAERDASAAAGRDTSPRAGPDASGGSGATRRLCAWCPGPIPARARRDAICCSVRCRQARHRFLRAAGQAGPVAGGRPLRLAYADPPYPGKAWLYRGHPDYAGEVDHAALIRRLAELRRVGAVHLRRSAARACWRCARPGYGWRPGTAANGPPRAGGRCTPGNRSSTAGGRQIIRDAAAATTRRFDRVRRRPGHHPARPGDRRQTRRGVPVDLRSARRRARRHPR